MGEVVSDKQNSAPFNEREGAVEDFIGRRFGQAAAGSGGSIRMKVRVSKTQFKELMEKADLGKGTTEFAQLVLKDCLEGKINYARVVPNQGQLEVLGKAKKWSLDTINE